MKAVRSRPAAAQRPTSTEIAGWRAFLTAHARLLAVLERELAAERGMPLTWYDVLVVLSESPDNRLRMHDVARAIVLSRAGLTRLVDRMAGAGLVQRVPCDDDRRGTFVVMTAAGREALDAASPVHLRGVREHFTAHLSEGELAMMRLAFGRVIEAISGTPPADARAALSGPVAVAP